MPLLAFPAAVAAQGQPSEAAAPAQPRTITYAEAVDLALRNSFKIVLSEEDIRAAQQSIRDARSQYYPRVSLQSTARTDLLRVGDFSSDDITLDMVLDWNPYRNGEVLRQNAQARTNFTIAQLTREQTILDTAHDTLALCVAIMKDKENLAVLDLAVEVEKGRLDLKQAEFDRQKINLSDLLDAQTKCDDLELEREKAANDLEKDLLTLREMTGDPTLSDVAPLDIAIETEPPVTFEDCLTASQMMRRALQIGRAKVTLARLGLKYAKLRRLPSFNLFTGTELALTEPAGDEFEFRVGAVVSYPLYDAGDTRSLINSAKAALRRAEIQLQQEEHGTRLEIREACWAFTSALRLVESAHRKQEIVEQTYNRARLQHEAGQLSTAQLHEAELAYRRALQRTHSLELDALVARSHLLKSIGVQSFAQIMR